MSLRNALSLVFALACLFQMGCAGCMNCARTGGGCGMCASCGVPEASCACPDCGCADPCCDVECGCPDPGCACPEPACGCVDECCDPCCGVPGCGTGVGQGCVLGTCPLLKGLRNLFCGCGCGCGGCGGETYCGDWDCNHACACEPCDQCGNYTGGQYSMPTGRQSHVADRVNADEIRFSATQKAARR